MKIFGLIGYPIDHSWSPALFRQKFQDHDADQFKYELFPLTNLDEFPDLLSRITDLCGVNVTIPYKEAIIPFLDELDPVANEIGAVNTIRIIVSGQSRKLIGYNTDAFGFQQSADFSGHTAALVLGTGGAARAVGWVLKKIGISFLLVSRNKTSNDTIRYSDLNTGIIRHHTLIVNATPVGMFPWHDRAPEIPYEDLSAGHFLYDLIYNPAETSFLRHGALKGARIQSGMQMLMLQAEASFRIFMDTP